MIRECASCAARDGEAVFPERKKRGEPRLCCDCLGASVRGPGEKITRRKLLTRAAWRARERVRHASRQMDLVDWLESRP